MGAQHLLQGLQLELPDISIFCAGNAQKTLQNSDQETGFLPQPLNQIAQKGPDCDPRLSVLLQGLQFQAQMKPLRGWRLRDQLQALTRPQAIEQPFTRL